MGRVPGPQPTTHSSTSEKRLLPTSPRAPTWATTKGPGASSVHCLSQLKPPGVGGTLKKSQMDLHESSVVETKKQGDKLVALWDLEVLILQKKTS